MLHNKLCGNWPAGSGKEDFFKGFYHIWAWRPSWSCDPDAANKHLFQRFQRRCLKLWTYEDGWTPEQGSGELKILIYRILFSFCT